MNTFPILIRIAAGFVLATLAGCGGGGGGGGGGSSAVVYSGNTNPAVISTTNASVIAANATGGADSAQVIGGVSVGSGSAAQIQERGPADLARHLSRELRGIAVRVHEGASTQQITPGVLVPVNRVVGCDGGGSMTITGSIDNVTGLGILSVTFNNCVFVFVGITINGPSTWHIDAVDLMSFEPTDLTMSFARLTLRGPGLSIDAGGSIRIETNIGTNTDTITTNLDELNNTTGKMRKTVDLVIIDVYDNIFFPTSFTETVLRGRVFHSEHGFVDLATTQMFVFKSLAQFFPDSGQMLLTGASGVAGNRAIRTAALNSTMVRLHVDLDGDGVFETTATMRWADLSGPVGSNIGDIDGDGIHNSWETANLPMNPNLNDAALDNDGDGFSNLAEYLGGGNPNNAALIPSMLMGSVFSVASDIATANSDTEMPGRSAIASDGTNYLLVSCGNLGSGVGLFGVLISESGQVMSIFPISSDSCPVRPAVAFDGSNYLVVLTRSGQIYGIRVTPGGMVLDGAGGFPISTAGSNFHPAVAFDGVHYLVAWNKFAIDFQYEIYGARVTPSGSALGEFPIFTAPGEQVFPALAFDGTNYLVVWRDTRSGSGPGIDTDIFGTRVTPAGVVLDPLGIAIATASGIQEPGGIAFDGTNYLVVWNHTPITNVSPPPEGKIFGRRIAPDGTLMDGATSSDGIAISTGPFANHSPSVAYAGNTFIVTWAVGSFPNFPPAGIIATRVSKNGARIDGLPNELGALLSGPPPSASRFVHPIVASRGQSALISWVNNIELSGAAKDLLGVSIFVP